MRSHLSFIEVGSGYRAGEMPLVEGSESAAIAFDLLGGGRYGYSKNEIDISSVIEAKKSQDWVALFIGGRVWVRADTVRDFWLPQ